MAAERILIGGCVRQDAEVLKAHLSTLQQLQAPKDVELSYLWIDDSDDVQVVLTDAAVWLSADHCADVWPADARPTEAIYAVDDVTHRWNIATFDHLAKQKQRILDYALAEGFDAVLLVDSDLLLSPDTLLSLWGCGVPVVSGVFWTQWTPTAPPLPQVWLRQPYELEGLGLTHAEFMQALQRRQCTRVAGGGACVLIRKEVLAAGVGYFPRLEGLPSGGMWQGEDRSFALRLQHARLRQYADAWPRIVHAYHPQQRTPQALQEAQELVALPPDADWLSLRIDALEDPVLDDSLDPALKLVRCRLSSGALMPDLQMAAAETPIGEERITEVGFPMDYPIAPYRGQRKLYRVARIA